MQLEKKYEKEIVKKETKRMIFFKNKIIMKKR